MFIGVCHTYKVLLEIGTIQVEVEKSRYQPKIITPMLPRRKGGGNMPSPPGVNCHSAISPATHCNISLN